LALVPDLKINIRVEQRPAALLQNLIELDQVHIHIINLDSQNFVLQILIFIQ
jgi:hypothetical protein